MINESPYETMAVKFSENSSLGSVWTSDPPLREDVPYFCTVQEPGNIVHEGTQSGVTCWDDKTLYIYI